MRTVATMVQRLRSMGTTLCSHAAALVEQLETERDLLAVKVNILEAQIANLRDLNAELEADRKAGVARVIELHDCLAEERGRVESLKAELAEQAYLARPVAPLNPIIVDPFVVEIPIEE
jgi:hypothetical protein